MASTSVAMFPLLLLAPALVLAGDCPCTFSPEVGEVRCAPSTQDLLPWLLPPCLAQTVGNDQVILVMGHHTTCPTTLMSAYSYSRSSA